MAGPLLAACRAMPRHVFGSTLLAALTLTAASTGARAETETEAEPEAGPSDPIEAHTTTTDPAASPPATTGRAPGLTDPEPTLCLAAIPTRVTSGRAHAGYRASAAGLAELDRRALTSSLDLALGLAAGLDGGGDACADAYGLALELGVSPRWDAGSDGGHGGLDTRADLSMGPGRHTDASRAVIGWALTSWELGYRGDLAARPRFADRADLARDLFDRVTLTGATRMFRVETADECDDDDPREHCQRPNRTTAPVSFALDIGVFEGAVSTTSQDTGADRTEVQGGFAFLRASVRDERSVLPYGGVLDLLRVDLTRSEIGAVVGAVDAVWPLRIEAEHPTTGTRYLIGWGEVIGFEVTDEAGTSRTVSERALGAIGFAAGDTSRGLGAGWWRAPYLTMAAEPMLEDRLLAEAWSPLGRYAVRGRAFAARTEALEPPGDQAAVVWTGGVELGAQRALGGMTFDLGVEAGRTFYAAIDGAAPAAGFTARTQLTVTRAGERSRTWSGPVAPSPQQLARAAR